MQTSSWKTLERAGSETGAPSRALNSFRIAGTMQTECACPRAQKRREIRARSSSPQPSNWTDLAASEDGRTPRYDFRSFHNFASLRTYTAPFAMDGVLSTVLPRSSSLTTAPSGAAMSMTWSTPFSFTQ